MNGKLAIVYWSDPSTDGEVKNLNDVKFAQQTNVGWVTFRGEKVLIVNAMTKLKSADTFEVTLIHRSLITKIEPLEVKKCKGL